VRPFEWKSWFRQAPVRPPEAASMDFADSCDSLSVHKGFPGGRYWVRTSDLCRVKALRPSLQQAKIRSDRHFYPSLSVLNDLIWLRFAHQTRTKGRAASRASSAQWLRNSHR